MLLEWYRRHCRDLPWRRTMDPYAIWVSEVMLQQTRVEAVIPYYARFLSRFPDIRTLAAASEQDVLAAWAGLGYYSRVRNMQRAAQQMVEAGGMPSEYTALRALAGVGDYTAAAVASIAFGQPYAAVDGNVIRVLARVTNDAGDTRSSVTRGRLEKAAAARLDSARPGMFNQAMMELGATLCTPKNPRCLLCPVQDFCGARRAGCERQLPVKSRPGERNRKTVTLLIITGNAGILLWQRSSASVRLAGFWELPEHAMLPSAKLLENIGEFKHTITSTDYTYCVRRANISRKPQAFKWTNMERLHEIPLSTTSRKALACLKSL